jgi:hypothetical protein
MPVDFTTPPASEKHDLGIVHVVHNHANVSEIDAILSQYVPPYVLSFLTDDGAKIVPLATAVMYARASTAIRRLSVRSRRVAGTAGRGVVDDGRARAGARLWIACLAVGYVPCQARCSTPRSA